MNAGDVEQCEIGGGGWNGTKIADLVTKLIRCTQFVEGCVVVKGTIPLLRKRNTQFGTARVVNSNSPEECGGFR